MAVPQGRASPSCAGCGAAVAAALDLGSHPVASHYRAPSDAPEEGHPMRVGQCARCSLVQFTPPVPADRLRSPHEWISYREPEAHLDDLVERVMASGALGGSGTVAGVSYKEDSTLARFAARGVGGTWRLDPAAHLGLEGNNPGLEAIQDRLRVEVVDGLRRARPVPDVIVVRHVLEHTHATSAFLAALRAWVRPEGLVVFEVPDATRALDRLDYCTLWEEHTLYLTSSTLTRVLRDAGFADVQVVRYPYELEDSLVAFTRAGQGRPRHAAAVDASEQARASRFFASFARVKARVGEVLAGERRPIALFGAGHFACAFLNYFEVRDRVSVVVDDDPRKQGLLMPGSQVPIQGSEALLRDDIGLCLMAMGATAAAAVAARQRAFLEKGGRFASIFPSSQGLPSLDAWEAA